MSKKKQKLNLTSNLLAVISICVLGILVYSNTFYSPFQFDDEFIAGNVSIRDLRDLGAIWSYCPTRFITFLSFAFNYHFNQLQVSGYHLVNLIIHLASAILVRWFILLTFATPAIKGKEIARHAKAIAFFGSLVFVAHPVQTQAVTYIWQRFASLATLLYLASLNSYIKARLSQNQRTFSVTAGLYYGCSMIAALLGMFTKELFITLPLMILLYEFCFLLDTPAPVLRPRRGGLRRRICRVRKKMEWKYIIPFLVMLLIIPLTMIVSKSPYLGMMRKVAEGYGEISRGHYFLTQFRVMVTYLRLLFVPLNQNLDYDYHISNALWEMPTLASGSFLLLILTSGILLFRRYRLISFSIFWFFLTLSVESSVIPLLNVIFEHRLYLPMVGYSIFLPTIIYYLCRKNLRLGIDILLMVIALYSVFGYIRNEVWRSEFALWNDTVSKSPGKARPYLNRGVAYGEMGVHRAISDFNQALRIDPSYVDAYNNRGIAYYNIGEYDKAISDFSQALRVNPNYADLYNNRGVVYGKMGEYDKAMSDFNQTLRLNPKHAKAYHNRGIGYFKRGELDNAIRDFTEALRIDPSYVDAYNNRGIAYRSKGEHDKAISDFERALSINPNHPGANDNLRATYEK